MKKRFDNRPVIMTGWPPWKPRARFHRRGRERRDRGRTQTGMANVSSPDAQLRARELP